MEFRRLGHAGDYGAFEVWLTSWEDPKITQDLGNFVLDQFLLSIHNLISGNYLLKCLVVFLFKTLYLQFRNNVSGRSSSEVGWARMDSRGAVRGTLGVSTRNPSANIRVCLFGYVRFCFPKTPRSMYFEHHDDSNLHWNLEAQEFVKGERDPNLRLRPLPNYRPCCSPTSAASCLPGHKDAEEKKRREDDTCPMQEGPQEFREFRKVLNFSWHCMTLYDIATLWHYDTVDCKDTSSLPTNWSAIFLTKTLPGKGQHQHHGLHHKHLHLVLALECAYFFLGVFEVDCQIWQHLRWGGGKSSAPPGMSSWNSGALCLHSQRSPGGVPGEWNS